MSDEGAKKSEHPDNTDDASVSTTESLPPRAISDRDAEFVKGGRLRLDDESPKE